MLLHIWLYHHDRRGVLQTWVNILQQKFPKYLIIFVTADPKFPGQGQTGLPPFPSAENPGSVRVLSCYRQCLLTQRIPGVPKDGPQQ